MTVVRSCILILFKALKVKTPNQSHQLTLL